MIKAVPSFLIIYLIFLSGSSLLAQIRSYNTSMIKGDAPQINGKLDDDAWEIVEWESNFTQFEPHEGADPSQKTLFKIVYDNDNLYVGIECKDSETDKIEKRLSRRDGWEGDFTGVQIDSYHDKRTAFVFVVNAGGVKNDGFFSNDGNNFDESWDPIWEVKTQINHDGWTAEMKIPFSQLRFSESEKQSWGLEVVRRIFRLEEFTVWQAISKDQSGWVSKYGLLEGIENIKPRKQIELAPFIVSKIDTYEKEEGNPFMDGRDFSTDLGLNGKIALTNNLILDVSVNPDFGQVEADPSEVNLTAYETYFSEKRPFFIEANNITDYTITMGGHPWAQDNLFYSRRIGRLPHYDPDLEDNQYIKKPANTKILGAVKLSGKTENGWSVGLIESLTRKEIASIDTEGEKSDISIEPMTNYFIGRIQKDLNDGNTMIGGIFTSTNRMIEKEDIQLNYLPSNAYTTGVDFTQYLKDKKYAINAMLVSSQISGSEIAMLDQQYSSRRNFQRPDAEYLSIDSSMTVMKGHGGNLNFLRLSNTGLSYGIDLTWRSPGLELNDVGYMRQGDIVFHFIYVNYNITEPFSIFRSAGASANEWSGWDFGNNLLFFGYNASFYAQFKNFWHFDAGINRENEGRSNDLLRGGPAIKYPGNINFFTYLSSNSTKKLQLWAGMSMNIEDENHGKYYNYLCGLAYRPVNALSINLEPSYTYVNSNLQYIHETELNTHAEYIFSRINQNTLSVTARVDFNLTPDLTIQYYGSPFISSAMFDEYKRITNPMATHPSDRYEIIPITKHTIYDIENNDFNFGEFKSNMILRWEYKPGSMLYLVWAQNRMNTIEDGSFDYVNNMDQLFSKIGHNTFLLKFCYRIRLDQYIN